MLLLISAVLAQGKVKLKITFVPMAKLKFLQISAKFVLAISVETIRVNLLVWFGEKVTSVFPVRSLQLL